RSLATPRSGAMASTLATAGEGLPRIKYAWLQGRAWRSVKVVTSRPARPSESIIRSHNISPGRVGSTGLLLAPVDTVTDDTSPSCQPESSSAASADRISGVA